VQDIVYHMFLSEDTGGGKEVVIYLQEELMF
jgi:hypothetical protein